jgi:hypothetical protein
MLTKGEVHVLVNTPVTERAVARNAGLVRSDCGKQQISNPFVSGQCRPPPAVSVNWEV